MNEQEFITFCQKNEPQEVADYLHENGNCDPDDDDSVLHYSSRALCCLAAEHVKGDYSYINFYHAMWGDGELRQGLVGTCKKCNQEFVKIKGVKCDDLVVDICESCEANEEPTCTK